MKRVQWIGHALAAANAFIGMSREVTVVTDTGELRSHDGVTPGGRQIPTAAQIAGFNFRQFNGVTSSGAPGNLADAVQGQFLQLTGAGAYNLPALSAITNPGIPIWVQATVAGVSVARKGADLISDLGVDQTSLNLAVNEIVLIAKLTAARYIVLNRY